MSTKIGKRFFLLLFLFTPIFLFTQQKPFIEIQLNRQRVIQDQTLSVTFVLFSDKEADEVPHWEIENPAFTTEYQMMTPHKSISMTYINGVRSERKEFRFSYTYQLRCSTIGTYRIASPLFTVQQKKVPIKYFDLEVVGIEKNPFYQLSISSLPRTLLVGERLNFDLDLAFERQISTPRYRINGLEGFDYILSNRGFLNDSVKVAVNNKAVEGSVITVNGKQVFRIPLSLVLKNPGKLSFSETHAGFRGVSSNSRIGFFGQYDEEEIMIPLENPQQSIEVLPLPSTGKPKDFSGLIGNLRLKVEATPTELKAGDPLTITITIENINDYLFELPPLIQNDLFSSQFRIPEAAPGKIERGNKIFIQTLRPLTKEVKSVPSILLNYYDTQGQRYGILKSDPIALTVHEALTISEEQIIYNTVAGRDLAMSYRNSRQFHNLAEGLNGESLSFPGKWEKSALIELIFLCFFLLLFVVFLLLFVILQKKLLDRTQQRREASLSAALSKILASEGGANNNALRKKVLEEAHNGLIRTEVQSTFQQEQKERALSLIDQMLFSTSPLTETIFTQGMKKMSDIKTETDQELKKIALRKRSRRIFLSSLFLFLFLLTSLSCEAFDSKPNLPLNEVDQLLLEAKMDFENGLDLIISQESSPLNFFRSAYDKWNRLVESGYQDDRIHFNLGNCSRFLKEDPLALYHYKMALLIKEKPLYREAVEAVIEANGLTQEENSFLTLAHRILYWNHQRSNLFRIMLVTFFLMAWSLISLVAQMKPAFQKKSKPIKQVLLLSAILTLIAFFADFAMPNTGSEGVIMSDVEGRSGNSYAYESALSAPLYPTQLFRLLESRDGWFYIALPNGLKCWIPQNSAKLIR